MPPEAVSFIMNSPYRKLTGLPMTQQKKCGAAEVFCAMAGEAAPPAGGWLVREGAGQPAADAASGWILITGAAVRTKEEMHADRYCADQT